eukprot:1160176-Pelagomonas_calceolata.AAC.11
MLALVLQICVGGRDIWQLGVPVQRDYCCKHSSNDFDTSPQSCNCPQRCKYTCPQDRVCDPGRGGVFLRSRSNPGPYAEGQHGPRCLPRKNGPAASSRVQAPGGEECNIVCMRHQPCKDGAGPASRAQAPGGEECRGCWKKMKSLSLLLGCLHHGKD